MKNLKIAVVGAGLGGVTAALFLLRAGYDVTVYERTPSFARIGAGIQMGPNILKLLREIELEDKTAAIAAKPPAWISRDGYTGEIIADIALNCRMPSYGAPYITVHRGDLHLLLVNHLPPERLKFSHVLTGAVEKACGVRLSFENQPDVIADIVIGGDGVNSVVRETILGPEEPIYTGYVGHRAIFPAERIAHLGLDENAKWWGSDRHFVAYYLDHDHKEFFYVTGVPQADWPKGVSHLPSSKEEMRAAFSDFHPLVRETIEATDDVRKWAFFTRSPLPVWSKGRLVLLGDACHPMKPHMAQGGAMAMEDAAMLFRCLERFGAAGDYLKAFAAYRANRMERASRVQTVSNANTWLMTNENPDWVYGYDLFAEPLKEPA